jgi:hypothetical protein
VPVFQAIGLGIAIIVLKVLTPQVFGAIERTALAFLEGATVSAEVATDVAASATTFTTR